MDDDAAVRATAGRMLAELGYRPTLASDGEEAASVFAAAHREGRPFDVVILDLTVRGGAGGVEAIRRIRALDARVPALVSSGYSQDPVMADHRRHGFSGVMPKPYALEELAEALQRAVAGAAPAQPAG
jgi:CheY-like chemotaxis protein